MNILKNLQLAIQKKNDGAVDTLVFINKVESLKNNSKNSFNMINNIARQYYLDRYNIPYSKEACCLYSYMGKEIKDDYYNVDEINTTSDELIINKIIKRVKDVKNSPCSFKYKLEVTSILFDYLKELNVVDNDSEIYPLFGRLLLKKYLMRLYLLFLLSLPFWYGTFTKFCYHFFEGNKKEIIYQILITNISILFVIIISGIYLIQKNCFKKQIIWFMTFIIIFTGFISSNLVSDIHTDISNYKEQTVYVKSISPVYNTTKSVEVLNSDNTTNSFYFSSDLNIKPNKFYQVKYNKSNIIVNINEIQ